MPATPCSKEQGLGTAEARSHRLVGRGCLQDVWSELGMPSGTSSKPHNAMAISAGGNPGGAAGGAGGNGADFFYHYSTRCVHFCSK